MSSALLPTRGCGAFRAGPLRSNRQARSLINLKATHSSEICAAPHDWAKAKVVEKERPTHRWETIAATLLASGMMASSCLAIDDAESATQAVQAAKIASDILRPLFNIFTILYIVRVPMTWYPDIDGKKLPWAIAYVPTEPSLSITRKVVPLVSGVDVSPIVWVGLLSFFSEILLGPQGLLTLIQARGGI